MKLKKRLLALGMVLVLAVAGLTGCGGQDTSSSEVEEELYIIPQAGGSVTWPEGMDTSVTFGSQMDDASGTLYVVFNGVQNRFTNYFTPAGDTITVNSYATSENENATTDYLVTLWKEGYGGREYVDGCTIEFQTGGDCATASFSGLDPNSRYKVGIAYMSGTYRISGGLSISGLSGAEALTDEETSEA